MLKAGLNVGRVGTQHRYLLSHETGLTALQLQGLEYVGKTAGITLEDMVMATRGLSRAMVEGSAVLADNNIRVKEVVNGHLQLPKRL